MGRGAKFMFSFASRAKPGKHFLVETDDEDGQLENGSVLQQGSDYAGEFLFFFFTKPLLFIFFFQVYRKQEKCEEGKEWKESKGERFCKNAVRQKISYFSILQARLSANVITAIWSSAHRFSQTMLVCFFCTNPFFVFFFTQKRILESKYLLLQSQI